MSRALYWRRFVTVVAAYALIGRFSMTLTAATGHETMSWPAAGLSLAAVVIWGRGQVAAVFVGRFLATTLWLGNIPWPLALVGSLASGASALLSDALLRRFDFSPSLDRIRSVTLFVVCGVLIGQLPNATVGPISLVLGGLASSGDLISTMTKWWSSAIFGVIWTAPVLLVCHKDALPKTLAVLKQRWPEILGFAFAFGCFIGLFYSPQIATFRNESTLIRPYLLFPFFVWAALRFHQRGIATLGFFVLVMISVATLLGATPLTTMNAGRTFEFMQAFVCVLYLTSLFLGAAVQQKAVVVQKLHVSEGSARARELELGAIFENSGVGHAQADIKTLRFLRVNRRLGEILGYEPGELVGRSFTEVTFPEDLPSSMDTLASLLRGPEKSLKLEKRYIKKNGDPISARVEITLMTGPEGNPTSILAVIEDVTERKRWEAALQHAKLAADAASLAKSQFLANISHEIRTPLGAILGFNEFSFDATQSQSERIDYAQRIKTNGDLLLKIINDVLDLSKIEAGRLEVETCRIDLKALLDDLESLMSFKIQKNKAALTICSDGPIPASIFSDPTKLRQILANLVGNAIKFSESGTVSVSVKYAEPQLSFVIKDNGIGMSPEQAARIFETFQQGDPSMTRKFGGTGLGLALARRLARALGGDVNLTATAPGKGSTFEVELDAPVPDDSPFFYYGGREHRRAGASREVAQGLPSLPQVRALVVDDAPDNRLLISRFLQREGAEVVQAESGEEAIEKALGGNFDVLLVDIQMPGLDGLQVTQHLRQRGYRGPILAVTANAMKGDRQIALDAGFDDHLTKPVSPTSLIASVRYFVDGSRVDA